MNPQTTRDIFDFLTAGAALAGVVLGLFNLWLYFDQRRVKLRVTPLAFHLGPVGKSSVRFWHLIDDFPDDAGLGVEVVNLSAFPVTITHAGFLDPKDQDRRIMVNPPSAEEPWPRRLEPREAIQAYMRPQGANKPQRRPVGKAFAMTACGTAKYGRSGALKAYQKLATKEASNGE